MLPQRRQAPVGLSLSLSLTLPFNPLPTPTALGISAAITAPSVTTTAESLAFDQSATISPHDASPTFLPSSTPVITPTQTPASGDSGPLSLSFASPTPSASSNSAAPIAMSTVIGSCVAAFIGTSALICLGFWFYRRYHRALDKQLLSRRAFTHQRNQNADTDRRRSHLEPWNRLDDTDDTWRGTYPTKESENVAPMEKLTMFKKTPSMRTAYTQWTHKSDGDLPVFEPQAFAPYHPGVAESVASKNAQSSPSLPGNSVQLVVPRPVPGRSATLEMAIPTPAAVESQQHQWESAEVLQYEPQPAEPAQDPFAGEPPSTGHRKSLSNPFDAAQSSDVLPPPKLNKGKGRAIDVEDNPFNDAYTPVDATPATLPSGVNHDVSNSESSRSSQDRALRSLIAALDIPQEEVQRRLRVASMQPSMISEMSEYSYATDDDLSVRAFPLPPSTPTTPTRGFQIR